LRDVTERPEAVEAGTVRIVGSQRDTIVAEIRRLLDDPTEYAVMSHAVNPYGDGRAAPRIVAHLMGEAVEEFVPSSAKKSGIPRENNHEQGLASRSR
jgi:UDP-N-acetylglucosamine 2-epimerase (non-hydrolysing)